MNWKSLYSTPEKVHSWIFYISLPNRQQQLEQRTFVVTKIFHWSTNDGLQWDKWFLKMTTRLSQCYAKLLCNTSNECDVWHQNKTGDVSYSHRCLLDLLHITCCSWLTVTKLKELDSVKNSVDNLIWQMTLNMWQWILFDSSMKFALVYYVI